MHCDIWQPSLITCYFANNHHRSANGLGKACTLELIKNGANVSILDMNDDGEDLAKELGPSAKFFLCDVLDSSSIEKAVQGTAEWAKQSNKPIGGVIPAAGVSTPATVRLKNCRKQEMV